MTPRGAAPSDAYGARVHTPATIARVKLGEIKSHPVTSDLAAGGEQRANAIARVAALMAKHHGNLTHTADALGTTRATVYRWLRTYPELAEIGAALRRASGQATHPPDVPGRVIRSKRKRGT